MKHTNLINEITGAYYEDKNILDEYFFAAVAIIVGISIVVVVVLALAIFDLFFPEVVTSVGVWLLELFR